MVRKNYTVPFIVLCSFLIYDDITALTPSASIAT